MVAASIRAEIDGRDITRKLLPRLLMVRVDDHEGETADACELEFDDRPPHVEWPPAGKSLHLWLGADDDSITDMGTFTLDVPRSSSPPRRLRVRGHSASFIAEAPAQLNDARTRLWETVTLGDLASTIARAHNLGVRVQPAIGAKLVGTYEQLDEGDLSMLDRLAIEHGGRARVKSGFVELVTAGAQVALPTHVFAPRDVERWDSTFGHRARYGTVVARWRNPKTGAAGASVAGGEKPALVLTETYESAQAADSAAKSKLKDAERHSQEIRFSLTAMDTRVVTGSEVSLTQFRPEIDTIWNVTKASHFADGRRARTTITAERSV